MGKGYVLVTGESTIYQASKDENRNNSIRSWEKQKKKLSFQTHYVDKSYNLSGYEN